MIEQSDLFSFSLKLEVILVVCDSMIIPDRSHKQSGRVLFWTYTSQYWLLTQQSKNHLFLIMLVSDVGLC